MRRRSYLTLTVSLLCGASAVIACSDDDTTATDPPAVDGGGADTSTSKADGSPAVGDASVDAPPTIVDAGTDAASVTDAQPDALVDAGPTVTNSLGSTGFIRIYNDAVFGLFYEDDTTLRASDSTNCVARLRSLTKPRSAAGVLSVGGPIVGSDGGAAEAIDLFPDDSNTYDFGGPIFGGGGESLLVGMDLTETFPTLNPQTLRSPPLGIVTVTKPARPDDGSLNVPSTQDLEIAWTPPADTTNLQMSVDFTTISGPTRRGLIFCTFPLASGSGRIPASLLMAVRQQLGAESEGLITASVGGAAEVVTAGASYVIRVQRSLEGTTNIPESNSLSATLQ